MAIFSNEQDFRNWLEGKPRDWSVALATRAALRVLPFLLSLPGGRGRPFEDRDRTCIVLPVFRANALPWAAIKYPAYSNVLALASARAAAADDAARAAGDAVARGQACLAALAAFCAVAAFGDDPAVAGGGAGDAADAADAVDAAASLWNEISDDASFLEQGGTPHALLERPLWIALGSSEALELKTLVTTVAVEILKMFAMWQDMAAALTEDNDEDWGVWVRWYRNLLWGKPSPWPEGVVVVLADNDIWKEGPKVVNAKIRALMDEASRKEASPEGIRPEPQTEAGPNISGGTSDLKLE